MNNTFKTLCLAATLSATLLFGSCQRMEVTEDCTTGIRYKVSSVNMGRAQNTKSGMSYFEGSGIPFNFCSYEGIGSCILGNEQFETRGTLYNEGDELSSFKACVYEGNKELFYDRVITWDGTMWADSEKAQWPEGKALRFLAYTNEPASGFELNSYPTNTEMNITVDKNAANQKDILIGYYNGTGDPVGTANIQFQHPMTAVVFKLGTVSVPDYTDVIVKSITLEGVAQKAQFNTPTSVNDADAAWTVAEDDQYTLAVSQAESSTNAGLPVAADGTIGDAFLLIPQDMAEHTVRAKIVLGLKKGTSFTQFSLFAKFDKGSWDKGNTNVYTIGYDEHGSDYQFTVVDNPIVFSNTNVNESKTFKVTSSCYMGTAAARKAVDFTVKYSIDGGENWADFDDAAQTTAGLALTKSAPSSYAYTVTLTSTTKNAIVMPANRWADDATVASDWDLSKCEIGGEDYSATNSQNTANTYIVKHAGSYRFPCVYGNSVRNGAATDAGYVSSATGSVMTNLLNAIGGEISTAYILDDVADGLGDDFHPRAALLWTDAKGTDGNLIVKNVALNNAESPEDAYISFETLDKSALVHGNAVIILYNDKDNDGAYIPYDITTTPETSSTSTNPHYTTANLMSKDIVLWSWQIWITDADLDTDHALKIGSGADAPSIMSRFLGWNDGDVEGAVTRYCVSDGFDRFLLRVIQNDSGKSSDIEIHQKDIFTYTMGSVPYYQYGRNVPSIGTYSLSSNPKKFYYADGEEVPVSTAAPYLPAQISSSKEDPIFHYSTSAKTFDQAKTYTMNGLKLPQIFVWSSYMDRTFTNLWSLNNTGTDKSVQTVKTVYDPSPYGYKIPNAMLKSYLDGKISSYKLGTAVQGWQFYNMEQNLCFQYPSTGYRNNDRSLESKAYSSWMTSSLASLLNQYMSYIDGTSISEASKYKGIAAPILPILDE